MKTNLFVLQLEMESTKKRKYQIEDLIKKDSIFVATGVTDGYLLSGVKKKKNIFETHSLIISTKTKKIDFKKSKFKI